jgi:hypothetical protein
MWVSRVLPVKSKLELMKPFYVGVAALNLVCLAALVVAFALGTGSAKAGLLSFAVVGGYFANLMAVLVSAFLIVVVVLRGRTGQAGTTLRANWLGVASGAVVVLAWSAYFAVGALRP